MNEYTHYKVISSNAQNPLDTFPRSFPNRRESCELVNLLRTC